MRGHIAVIILLLSLTSFSLAIMPSFCTVSATLHIYTDNAYTSLAPTDKHGYYNVTDGETVYIQIASITEFSSGDHVIVKVCWSSNDVSHIKTYTNVLVHSLSSGQGVGTTGVGDNEYPIAWIVGDFDDGYYQIPYCQTLTIHYKANSNTGPEYVAGGTIMQVGHLHVIPGNPVGSIIPIAIMFMCLFIFYFNKRKGFHRYGC